MIVKSALILFRTKGNQQELLFVRAYDKPFFVFPGGKQEGGETIENALQRELLEELKVHIKNIQQLGTVTGRTPDNQPLQMHLFSANLIGNPVPSAEIQELVWMSQDEILLKKEFMTPMTLDHVLPFLTDKKLW